MSLKVGIHERLGPKGIEAQNLFGSDPVWFEIFNFASHGPVRSEDSNVSVWIRGSLIEIECF